jgi:uncharacterized protein YbjT (DUF2867 family)
VKILVIGGTGMVGARVVEALLSRGANVRVLSRSPGDRPGVEYVVGDLAAPETLIPAFEGVSKLFLLTPLAENETELGLIAVAAADEAGVRHIVFQSVHRVEEGPHIPHFKTKIQITEGLKASGIPYTLILPNNFDQNDVWLQEPITRFGVYPQPIGGVGLSRVDVRDIADAAAIALVEKGHEGKSYALVGPDILTGEECAETWSRHMGREIRYGGDDLDAWAEQARAMMPDWMVHDLGIMYAHFQEHGLQATDEELAELEGLLDRVPRSFDSFVAELASEWR